MREKILWRKEEKILCSKDVRNKINIMKFNKGFRNNNQVLEHFINLDNAMEKIMFKLTRENTTIQVNGLVMLEKIKEGWNVINMDYGELLKDGQVQN